ncbi:MAG: rhodanese-like domain-containing protein [Planctomycetaceae bacterium]
MRKKPMETDCPSVKARLEAGDDFLFLDVREQDEFDHASIEGSTLIPMSEIQQRVSELEPHKEKDIVVFCHHVGRSMQVTMWLAQQGFTGVKNMTGGIDVWSQSVDSSIKRY